jgi:DNA-binding NarL/FixJ family response regulator
LGAITERVCREVPQMDLGLDRGAERQPLTERETQVLRMIAGGYRNREIAEALSCAEGTIKNHISNLLAKLGARDRTRAVLVGIEMGII